MIQLNPDQQNALSKMTEFLKTPKLEFRLGGLAGTGKTTIIQSLLQQTNMNCAVAAFTGKAVDVLRKKNVSDAQTLHSLLYYYQKFAIPRVVNRYAKNPICIHGKFVPRDYIPYDLVIIDEASMVDQDLYHDLQNHGKKVILVGDYGQLQPVNGKSNYMDERYLDCKLERVERQKLDNPILKASMLVRDGRWSDIRGKDRITDNGIVRWCNLQDDPLWGDVVICKTNNWRIDYNKKYRAAMGYTGPFVVGEKLVCQQNNKQIGVFNGQSFTVNAVYCSRGHVVTEYHDDKCYTCSVINKSTCPDRFYYLTLVNDMGVEFNSRVSVKMLNTDNYMKSCKDDRMYVDYGYAITCHKAQGSEWDNVAISLQDISLSRDNDIRWLYTALTRARKEVRFYE